MSLTNRILLAMVLGIALGSILNVVVAELDPSSGLYGFLQNGLIMGLFDGVGRIFVASLKLLVVPLVLVSLICGMAALGQSSRMGAIAGKTVGLYLITTGVAVSLGLTIATIVGLVKAWLKPMAGSLCEKKLRHLSTLSSTCFPPTRYRQWPRAICCRSLFLRYWLALRPPGGRSWRAHHQLVSGYGSRGDEDGWYCDRARPTACLRS